MAISFLIDIPNSSASVTQMPHCGRSYPRMRHQGFASSSLIHLRPNNFCSLRGGILEFFGRRRACKRLFCRRYHRVVSPVMGLPPLSSMKWISSSQHLSAVSDHRALLSRFCGTNFVCVSYFRVLGSILRRVPQTVWYPYYGPVTTGKDR